MISDDRSSPVRAAALCKKRRHVFGGNSRPDYIVVLETILVREVGHDRHVRGAAETTVALNPISVPRATANTLGTGRFLTAFNIVSLDIDFLFTGEIDNGSRQRHTASCSGLF